MCPLFERCAVSSAATNCAVNQLAAPTGKSIVPVSVQGTFAKVPIGPLTASAAACPAGSASAHSGGCRAGSYPFAAGARQLCALCPPGSACRGGSSPPAVCQPGAAARAGSATCSTW